MTCVVFDKDGPRTERVIKNWYEITCSTRNGLVCYLKEYLKILDIFLCTVALQYSVPQGPVLGSRLCTS